MTMHKSLTMRLYPSTTPESAEKIVADGFRDSSGYYMIPDKTSGVWLAEMPLDANEGTRGDTTLIVDLAVSEQDIAEYEWIEEGKPYREWQIPAKLINENASIRLATEEEVDEAEEIGWKLRRERCGLTDKPHR